MNTRRRVHYNLTAIDTLSGEKIGWEIKCGANPIPAGKIYTRDEGASYYASADDGKMAEGETRDETVALLLGYEVAAQYIERKAEQRTYQFKRQWRHWLLTSLYTDDSVWILTDDKNDMCGMVYLDNDDEWNGVYGGPLGYAAVNGDDLEHTADALVDELFGA